MTVTAEYRVTGMTCQHCVAAVTQEVGLIEGVNGVAVDLQPGGESVVQVTSAGALAADDLAKAIEEAGYELVR
jgi:copper ion binding protein